MTSGSSMQAMNRTVSPQAAQVWMSMPVPLGGDDVYDEPGSSTGPSFA